MPKPDQLRRAWCGSVARYLLRVEAAQRLSSRIRSQQLLVLVLVAFMSLQPCVANSTRTSAFDLSSVKVVSLYESILDTDKQTLTNILADTGTEVVFRAYFQVAGPGGTNTHDPSVLRDIIAYVKARLPWVHFMGGVDAYGYCGGLPANASELLYVLPDGSLPQEAPSCYDLDIVKPAAQKVVLSMAYGLVDAGFDSLFFDCLDCLAGTFNLPVKSYMEAWRQIASAVKNYAQTKYGREVQVCVNTAWNVDIWPYQDFISLGLTGPDGAEMIRNQKLQIGWGTIKANIKNLYGRLLPIMFFLDWGSYKESPMVALASLPPEDQIKAITLLHDTALREGLLFVYPIHGGDIMTYAQIQQGLPWRVYDAVQQGTYDAIKQLTSTILTVHTMTVTTTSTQTLTARSTETLTATVTANRTITAPAPPLIENPVLISAGVLGIAVVLAAIIMRKRVSPSRKTEAGSKPS